MPVEEEKGLLYEEKASDLSKNRKSMLLCLERVCDMRK